MTKRIEIGSPGWAKHQRDSKNLALVKLKQAKEYIVITLDEKPHTEVFATEPNVVLFVKLLKKAIQNIVEGL